MAPSGAITGMPARPGSSIFHWSVPSGRRATSRLPPENTRAPDGAIAPPPIDPPRLSDSQSFSPVAEKARTFPSTAPRITWESVEIIGVVGSCDPIAERQRRVPSADRRSRNPSDVVRYASPRRSRAMPVAAWAVSTLQSTRPRRPAR